jgi:tetratricopeptide (TPR) repeat protein
MKVYSSREVAGLLGMSIPQVRAQARAGFLRPERGPRRAYRFSFQDLVLLRSAKALGEARIPSRRVRQALRRLRKQLPQNRSLTDIRIVAENGRIVVRDGASIWNPESGQFHLEFKPARRGSAPPAPKTRKTGHRPDPADDHVALGRRLYDANEVTEAIAQYRKALSIKRHHPAAAFHLGVALEDLGKINEAIDAYRRAVESDPFYAEAHLNLARLYEKAGKKTAARRHLKSYRELTIRKSELRSKRSHPEGPKRSAGPEGSL